jgi:hypothetical protein
MKQLMDGSLLILKPLYTPVVMIWISHTNDSGD